MKKSVQIMPGAEGIINVYERTLSEKVVDFVCTAEGYEGVLNGWYGAEYAPRLAKSDVRTREILPGTEANRAEARTKADKNQVRFLAGERSESDLIVAGDWAALVSFNPQSPVAIVIEDIELVAGLRRLFDQLWVRADKK